MISLDLYYVRTGESTTIDSAFIVKDSVSFKEELINELKSASNLVTLQILGSCEEIEKLIKEESDIKAVLKDDDKVLFTGYVSNSWQYTISHTGAKAVSITLEDVGTRLLQKEFIERGAHLFSCSVHEAIVAICDKAGVEINSDTVMLQNKVLKTVEGGVTCKALLQELLFEVGYVYYFDEYGKLLLHPIAVKVEDEPISINGDKLLDGLSVKKSVREYRYARVSYKSVAEEKDVLIYRNNTNQSNAHPFCYLSIDGVSIFDGAEIYKTQEEGDHVYPSISANNASGNENISSNEIIAVKAIRQEFVAASSYVESTVTPLGGPYIKIRVENKSEFPQYVTRLDVYGTAIYYKSTNIIKASTEALDGESGSTFSYDITWLHDKASCQRAANLFSQYYRYSSAKYTFYTNEDIPSGTVVKLTDDVFTGLVVNVIITKKSYKYNGSSFSYEAVGISEFDLDKAVIEERIYSSNHPIKGDAGKDAVQVVILASSGTIYRSNDTSYENVLTARVFQGGEDITSAITGEHFKWSRKSEDDADDVTWNEKHSKLTTNSINITLSDLNGKSSFFAEYIT